MLLRMVSALKYWFDKTFIVYLQMVYFLSLNVYIHIHIYVQIYNVLIKRFIYIYMYIQFWIKGFCNDRTAYNFSFKTYELTNLVLTFQVSFQVIAFEDA